MNKKTLVLGASLKLDRYSNYAIHKLVEKGVEVVAVGAVSGVVAGVKIDSEMKPFEGIHTVTLYLNPTNQKPYYDYIISLKPKRVIFNPGTENPELYNLLNENAIDFETACSLVLLSTNQY
ncbi:CoA-binding protein [Aestuariibaculum suncheonense]|uniref:CoA-binding protein n=1 Tax=Aestuariibaculum suncheonense TaxID=1028745 RepID=A0A8J6U9X7_9FLAO|nr:CoA-binding protein [Aestuariibaculum suncheonense]MBD0834568.1 CoA-binding protein [Aestuariibaculum suncheonense]